MHCGIPAVSLVMLGLLCWAPQRKASTINDYKVFNDSKILFDDDSEEDKELSKLRRIKDAKTCMRKCDWRNRCVAWHYGKVKYDVQCQLFKGMENVKLSYGKGSTSGILSSKIANSDDFSFPRADIECQIRYAEPFGVDFKKKFGVSAKKARKNIEDVKTGRITIGSSCKVRGLLHSKACIKACKKAMKKGEKSNEYCDDRTFTVKDCKIKGGKMKQEGKMKCYCKASGNRCKKTVTVRVDEDLIEDYRSSCLKNLKDEYYPKTYDTYLRMELGLPPVVKDDAISSSEKVPTLDVIAATQKFIDGLDVLINPVDKEEL